METIKLDFIGFNAMVRKEGRPGEIEILVHAGKMDLADDELANIKKATENFAATISSLLHES